MSYNEWLDIDVLEDYLDGKLDAKTMHKVEKISLEDPFVAEALAGLSQSPKRNQSLSLLQKQLQARIAQKPLQKKMWTITSQRLSIGAAAAVLFIAVSILFWMKTVKRQETLASNTAKKIDVIVAPQITQNKTEAKVSPSLATGKNEPIIANNSISITKKAKVPVVVSPVVVANQQPVEVITAAMASTADRQAEDRNEKLNEVTVATARGQSEKRVAVTALPSKAEGIVAGYLNGTVISKENGLPLSGATVRVQGVDRVTMTDKNGEFNILGDSVKSQTLTVGYVGYNTKELDVRPNERVNVILENNSASLKALTITNLSTNFPLGGWDNYQSYLKTNNMFVKNSNIQNEVVLSFEVKKDGSITAVKVEKSADRLIDREAIRLLKDGPKWIYKSGQTNVGRLKIQF